MDQRMTIFLGAIAAAVLLVIIAALYWSGHMFYPTGVHHKHAILAIVLAAGALVIANFNRPSAAVARR
ncbi:MAG TPA: hypothetical protein VN837_11625 [Chloroflexota bacterium]|nr:hypothetical protein [Chloroflexota bacterium]HXT36216.1 hypothetical protein [Chloroflexota bacterium]